MKNKMRTIIIYLLIVWGFGCIGGIMLMTDKYQEQLKINNNLYHVIQSKDNAYDELEQMMIEYRWKYESCQTMFGDYQDKVEAGCYVNGGWNCE